MGELLEDGDGLRARRHETGEDQVAAQQAGHDVAELFLMDEHLLALGQPSLQHRVELVEQVAGVVVGPERHVLPAHAELVVGVQVVR